MGSEEHIGCKNLFFKWHKVQSEQEHIGSAKKDL